MIPSASRNEGARITESSNFDELAEFKAYRDSVRTLLKGLDGLARLRPASPDVLDRLERALAALPPSDAVRTRLEELRLEGERILKQARSARIEKFSRVEAEFVNEAKRQGRHVRELENAWRFDEIEIQVRRVQAAARILYNREPLTEWSPVGSREHLDGLITKAKKKLEGAAFSNATLADLLWRAYAQVVGSEGHVPSRVRLADMYRVIRERSGKAGQAVAGETTERSTLPKWAFLYNLDRYRRLATGVPERQRLAFEQGSQRETARIGMVLNGLDAADEYKVYCYALPTA